jgi:hypothetical protein
MKPTIFPAGMPHHRLGKGAAENQRCDMSNRNKIYSKGRIQGQFTAMRYEVMDSAAWRQMSMGARILYIALIKPLSFNADNNGKIFLSTRNAAKDLGANQESVCIWFRELEHYGFIVMTEPGTIGPKGKATHWRITDVGWGRLDGKSIEPTKDYLKWSGEVFDRASSSKTLRPEKPFIGLNGKTVHLGCRVNGKTVHIRSTPLERKNRSYLVQPSPHLCKRQAERRGRGSPAP